MRHCPAREAAPHAVKRYDAGPLSERTCKVYTIPHVVSTRNSSRPLIGMLVEPLPWPLSEAARGTCSPPSRFGKGARGLGQENSSLSGVVNSYVNTASERMVEFICVDNERSKWYTTWCRSVRHEARL